MYSPVSSVFTKSEQTCIDEAPLLRGIGNENHSLVQPSNVVTILAAQHSHSQAFTGIHALYSLLVA